MKKKILFAVLGTVIIIASVLAVIFFPRDSSSRPDPVEEAMKSLAVYTEEGFMLTYNEDGNYYTFSSIGTFEGTDLVIPAYYNGIPIKRFTQRYLDELENITSISLPDTIEEISLSPNDAPNLKFNEYENGFYVGNDKNPYYALVKYNRDVNGNAVVHNDTKVIGSSAFWRCEDLTSVTLPEGLKSICHTAFSRCESLTAVVIPDSVTNIGYNLFNECEKLGSVVLGAGITELSDSMFHSCKALRRVEIKGKITKIGKSAFYNCESLYSFEVPESVTEIEAFAFSGCTSLRFISMHKGVEIISEYAHFPENAFYNEYLGGLYLGDNENPYLYLVGLKNEEIESLVLHPDTYSVIQGVIPATNTLTSLAVEGGDGKYLYSDGNCIIKKEEKLLLCGIGTSVIPSSGIEEIASYAFSNCQGIESIIIPDSVTKLGRNVFYSCKLLVSVELGKNITEIGNQAFLNCYSLESITIPESLREIPGGCFANCRSLKEVTVTDKTEVIGTNAFANCEILLSVSLSGVKVIKDGAFVSCEALQKVSFSDKLGFIGDNAFKGCIVLKNIILPISLRHIGDSAFKGCKALTYINIPNSVETFGKAVYKKCSSLESAVIPASREDLYLDEFALCTGLKKIYLPSTLKQISGYGVIGACESLEEIIFSGTVEQWNNLEKNDEWNVGAPAFKVICTNGAVEYPADERRYENHEDLYW